MKDIKKFADQLNELKRNTVVAINEALNELNKLQEEGKDTAEEVKTFSESPEFQECVKNHVQEAVQEAVQNTVQEAVQNAVQEAMKNIAKEEKPAGDGEQKTFSDAANVAQAVAELVNLPQELKNEKVENAINAVAEVATELMKNDLKVDTVQNAVQSLDAAGEEADEAAKAAVANVLEVIDVAVKNQPKTFSDSLEEIMKQEKENNADPKEVKEGEDGKDGERKEFANLSPTLRYLLGKK